ncbi:hypothetical protein HYW32_02955 [Candidatus Berkelbacteria bacterium]|nr:hypothetical protein [Candidatus Berkelbacteria bacterium]
MLLTPHILVGATVGVVAQDPVVGFLGGVASHFVLDAITHTDPGTWHFDEPFPQKLDERDLTVGFTDAAVAFFSFLLLAGVAPLVAPGPLAGALGGLLPDVIGLAPLFIPKLATVKGLDRYYAFTHRIHRTAPPSKWLLGIFTQIIVIGFAVWYLLGS